MTDVLARLGARVMGAAPILRPLVPGLFEPAAPARHIEPLLPSIDVEAVPAWAATERSVDPASTGPVTRTSPGPHDEALHSQPDRRLSDAPAERGPLSDRVHPQDVVNVTVIQPRDRIVETVMVAPPRNQSPPDERARAAPAREGHLPELAPSPRGDVRPATPPVPPDAPRPRVAALMGADDFVMPRKPARDAASLEAHELTRAADVLDRLRALRSASEHLVPPPVPSTPPAVRVSIGRVDVRATPIPAPPPAAPAARGGPSLGEYLSAGSRRDP